MESENLFRATDTRNELIESLTPDHADCGKRGLAARGHTCVLCATNFASRARLLIHDTIVHGRVRRHGCPRCTETFRLRLHLSWHEKSVHAQSGSHDSDTTTRSDFSMWRRGRIVVGRRSLLLCSYCGKCCHGRRALEWHRSVIHRRKTSCSYRKDRELFSQRNGLCRRAAIRHANVRRVNDNEPDVDCDDVNASSGGDRTEEGGERNVAHVTDRLMSESVVKDERQQWSKPSQRHDDGDHKSIGMKAGIRCDTTDATVCDVNASCVGEKIERKSDVIRTGDRHVDESVNRNNGQRCSKVNDRHGGNRNQLVNSAKAGVHCGVSKTVFSGSKSSVLKVGKDIAFQTFSCVRPLSLSWKFATAKKQPEKQYTCSECGLLLKAKKNLSRHLAIIHGYGRFFQCSFCGRRIRCKSELIHHIRATHQTVLTMDEVDQLVPIENQKPLRSPTSSSTPTLVIKTIPHKHKNVQQTRHKIPILRVEDRKLRDERQSSVDDEVGVTNRVTVCRERGADEVVDVSIAGNARRNSIDNNCKESIVDDVETMVVCGSPVDDDLVTQAATNRRNLFEEVQRRFFVDAESGDTDDVVVKSELKSSQVDNQEESSLDDEKEGDFIARMAEKVGDISVLPPHIRYPVWVSKRKAQQQPQQPFILIQPINLNACRVRGTSHLYKCPDCKKHLKGDRTFRRHMGVMHGKGNYHQCSECERRFRGPSELQRHVNTVHSDRHETVEMKTTSPIMASLHYPCVLCGDHFPSRDSVNVHRQLAHQIEGITTNTPTNPQPTSHHPSPPDSPPTHQPHHTHHNVPWLPSFYYRPTANFRERRFAMSETLLRKMARTPLKRDLFVNCKRSMRVDSLALKLAERRTTSGTNMEVELLF